jgi:hypothetical protein
MNDMNCHAITSPLLQKALHLFCQVMGIDQHGFAASIFKLPQPTPKQRLPADRDQALGCVKGDGPQSRPKTSR